MTDKLVRLMASFLVAVSLFGFGSLTAHAACEYLMDPLATCWEDLDPATQSAYTYTAVAIAGAATAEVAAVTGSAAIVAGTVGATSAVLSKGADEYGGKLMYDSMANYMYAQEVQTRALIGVTPWTPQVCTYCHTQTAITSYTVDGITMTAN